MKDEKKIYKYYDGSGNGYIIKYEEKIIIEYYQSNLLLVQVDFITAEIM